MLLKRKFQVNWSDISFRKVRRIGGAGGWFWMNIKNGLVEPFNYSV